VESLLVMITLLLLRWRILISLEKVSTIGFCAIIVATPKEGGSGVLVVLDGGQSF